MEIKEILANSHPAIERVLNSCKNQIENSSWHIEQPLTDHLVKTKSEVEKIAGTLGPNYLLYLGTKVGNQTKGLILQFVALTHDIGKNSEGVRVEESEIYDPFSKGHNLKKTSYKGHEEAGGMAIVELLEEIEVPEKEKDYIGFFISNHDFAHQAVEAIYKGSNRKVAIQKCKNQVGPLYPELLLHTLADMRAGTLDQVDKKEFDFREQLLLELIQEQEHSQLL